MCTVCSILHDYFKGRSCALTALFSAAIRLNVMLHIVSHPLFSILLCCAESLFPISSRRHSLMCVLLCSVCPASCCIPSGLPVPGGFVLSAVPVPPPPGVNIEEHIQIRQEEKRQRINRRHRLEEGRGTDGVQTKMG